MDHRVTQRNVRDTGVCGVTYVTPIAGQDAKPTVGGDGAPSQPTVDEDDEVRGQLADSAASVLVEILYAARMARFDLLRPVQGLAKWFTKWKKEA